MPAAPKLTKSQQARLARLPRLPDLVIEGGKRTVDIYIRNGDDTFKPEVTLWVDADTTLVRGTSLVNPAESADGGVSEALVSLLNALTKPMPVPLADEETAAGDGAPEGGWGIPEFRAPPAGLPTKLLVNDPMVADAAHAIFAPLGVPVEQSDNLPAFDEAFDSMAEYMGADANAAPPEPFSWDVDLSLLPDLYKAVLAYARLTPWDYMLDHPPVAVTLRDDGPERGVQTLYASILGAGGEVTGVAFYYSLDDFKGAAARGVETGQDKATIDEAIEGMRQAGGLPDGLAVDDAREIVRDMMERMAPPARDVPQTFENCLAFFLEFQEDTDPTYIQWLKSNKLKYARDYVPQFLKTAPDSEPRLPNEREVKALTDAVTSLAQFFRHRQRELQGPFLPVEGLAMTAIRPTTKAAIGEVRFPPPDYEWDDESADDALQPASPQGQATLYRFQVKLQWKTSVWRRIDLRGDQTLHDLHLAIQQAFDWDDDHLYAFFLSGKGWDEASEYESPFGQGRSAANYRLENLPLRQGQRILYIFDFGDELRHAVTLEAITPGAVQAGVNYPRLAESHGQSVPQYPDLDDDVEVDE